MSKGSDFRCVANLERVVYDQESPRGRLPLTDASVNEERELFENEPKQSLREAKRAFPDLSLSAYQVFTRWCKKKKTFLRRITSEFTCLKQVSVP